MSNRVPQIRFNGYSDAWVQRNLAELATMNARIGWQNLRTSEFLDEGDYILITGTDFKDGEIDYSNIHYVEKERFDQDKKIQVQDGSILITKDGTLGKVAYVKNLPGPATLNAGVFNVRVINSDETDSKYLFHYLKAPFLLKFADEQSTGGTIKHLNQNVLVKFPVPLPGLDEQKRIANLLESMDNLIAANQRKLDLLKEQKKGYLQKMFPKNGAKVPELRFAGFADAWEERKLGQYTKLITKGTTPKDKTGIGDVNFVKVENITNGKIYPINKIKQHEHDNYLKRSRLEEKDILFSIAGTLGRTAIVNKSILPANTNQALAIIRGYDFDTNFLITSLAGNVVKEYIRRNPTVGAQPNLSLEQVGNLLVNTPNAEEQQKIGSFFKQLDDTIALHQRELDLLKEQKKGYLQKMFC
ncbi:restriction endonuclease subunit S [Lactiplantibacillus plantarum]|uniref:restriction endonuclease subunit S n=1 Tax=Lactiplantibacillus plantarum TaxID=1590 RepID=UPI00287364B9|nr:restriction endonuclease subunit S [Lactiplantibacillus plantarum]WNC18979.1 restriction endonuclease subunit S [Lactiplantibacillus plantarum]